MNELNFKDIDEYLPINDIKEIISDLIHGNEKQKMNSSRFIKEIAEYYSFITVKFVKAGFFKSFSEGYNSLNKKEYIINILHFCVVAITYCQDNLIEFKNYRLYELLDDFDYKINSEEDALLHSIGEITGDIFSEKSEYHQISEKFEFS